MNRTDRILRYLCDYTRQHGYPPTNREIGQGCGISSTSVVDYHLGKLERAGQIQRALGRARAIRICEGAT